MYTYAFPQTCYETIRNMRKTTTAQIPPANKAVRLFLFLANLHTTIDYVFILA